IPTPTLPDLKFICSSNSKAKSAQTQSTHSTLATRRNSPQAATNRPLTIDTRILPRSNSSRSIRLLGRRWRGMGTILTRRLRLHSRCPVRGAICRVCRVGKGRIALRVRLARIASIRRREILGKGKVRIKLISHNLRDLALRLGVDKGEWGIRGIITG
ncbi:hypothetical protein LTR95_008518, partial [Oleoguttula sp. CCFEE 5521]